MDRYPFEEFWKQYKGPGSYLPPVPGLDPRIQDSIERTLESVARKCYEQGYYLGKSDGVETEQARIYSET